MSCQLDLEQYFLYFFQGTLLFIFPYFYFFFFGVMMIYEAYHLEPKSANEKVKELEDDLMEQEDPEAEAVNMELTENTNIYHLLNLV